VFCVFGRLPAEIELQGLRKLMEINLFLGNDGNTIFGRDPDSGQVNFRFEQNLAETTIEGFVDALDQIAGQAAEWRDNFFLGDDAEETPEFSAFQFA
jgi:Tir chaperone protein (CesT) family